MIERQINLPTNDDVDNIETELAADCFRVLVIVSPTSLLQYTLYVLCVVSWSL